MMIRTRVVAAVCVAAAGAGLAAGCSSSGGSGGAAGSSPAAPTATGGAVSAQHTSLGTILVDGRGRTVYAFGNDAQDRSTCDGQCAAQWPPVPAPTTLPASLPGVKGQLGTTTRSDGSRQITVAGHPLYTFSGDSAAGQTHGQGITLNGGLWTVVSPAGTPETHPAGSTQAPSGGPVY